MQVRGGDWEASESNLCPNHKDLSVTAFGISTMVVERGQERMRRAEATESLSVVGKECIATFFRVS